ncbi:MAG: trypsin-like peptidase domain-containing protein [Pirellulaceae bacterium]|jgi:serine protease Do|nr:trypsin-like peptidase domain-containing protein [Pirellulaceae bacterium]MDP7020160.1 trypsin-like peptidase domain-containing protein [Pirellulaceae bacterium]
MSNPFPQDAHHHRSEGSGLRMTGVLAFFGLLLVLRFVVPYMAEEIQYSLTRGAERARYELASVELEKDPFRALSHSYQLIAKKVSPSVVHINVIGSSADDPDDEFAYLFPDRPRQSRGQGSGVIVDDQGHIVTNHHVIRGAEEIEVALSDGRRVRARVVGADPPTDIAVLKINADKLTPAEWGDSERLEVGSLVWALGSPFGLQRSITSGILSAKNRAGMAGNAYQDFLQTDAAVNPGNSGGPLVNDQGRIIGINTAIVGESYQGISFSIPSSVAREVFERLVRDGVVERGWLGVQMLPVDDPSIAEGDIEVDSGALVLEVVSVAGLPSPAQEAGIQRGDVIVGWNERSIDSPTDLSRAVAQTPVGSTAEVAVVRGRRELKLDVTVGQRPERPH